MTAGEKMSTLGWRVLYAFAVLIGDPMCSNEVALRNLRCEACVHD